MKEYYFEIITREGYVHRNMGICCQDKGKFINEKGVYALAMADGAGSKFYADRGAEIAAERGLKCIINNFDSLYNEGNICRASKCIIEEVLYYLMTEAEKKNCDYREFASTLAIAAIKENRYILFSLGDSSVYKIEEGKRVLVMAPYNCGSKNITVLTTTNDGYKAGKIKRGTVDGIDGFIIMTDGMTELYSYLDLKNVRNISELCKKVEYSLDKYDDIYNDDCGFGVIYDKKSEQRKINKNIAK